MRSLTVHSALAATLFAFVTAGPVTAAAAGKKQSLKPAEAATPSVLLPVVQDKKWGYIDEKGTIVIPFQFDKADSFHEGLAAVQIGKQVGYIDPAGKIIINPTFDDAWAFENGIAPVKIGKNLGYIDRQGKFIWEPRS